ncbi:oxidoreductase [Chitinimonas koreensis]|uniref:oxidoreductase n=1 Tax=Chitinimonas koreensis TaxID=356302 RepID=UPI000404507A|nr:oxidoreductase [Chitinimonas koreensis]QNM97571.1 oxidoreductase [Chitinimonas koreensis]
MSQPLSVGLVGYGYAGRTFHAPLIAATPGLGLAAVASSQAAAVAADFPAARIHATPEALFADPGIDLVVLATPNASHAPLALAALAAGRHVVVDKPFTVTLAEAERLEAAAAAAGRLLSVFHNRRWDSDFLLVRQAIEAGRLGRVTAFESRFDRFRPQVRQRWRESAEPGGGIWYDLGPHLVDQALCLFGLPQAVSADLAARRDGAEADDDALVTLHYADRRVLLMASCLVAGGAPRFLVHGTAGSLEIHGLDAQEDQLKQGLRPGDAGWAQETRSAVLHGAGGRSALALPAGDYAAYYAGVRDAVLGHGPNPVAAGEAVAVMRVLAAALGSQREGRRVELG